MRKFLVSIMAIVSFGFVFYSWAVAPQWNSTTNVTTVYVLECDHGNQFYVNTPAGYFDCTRSKVGSLAYDQWLSLAETATFFSSPTRKNWLAADTTGLGAANSSGVVTYFGTAGKTAFGFRPVRA